MNVFITGLIFIDMKCLICKKELVGRQRKYCSSVCKGKDTSSYEAQQRRGLERKVKLIELMGGKCVKCGYKKNYSALSFHHKYPNEKETTLDMRSLSNNSWAKISAEASKCELLCMNCHMETHHPQHEKLVGGVGFKPTV